MTLVQHEMSGISYPQYAKDGFCFGLGERELLTTGMLMREGVEIKVRVVVERKLGCFLLFPWSTLAFF